MYRLRNLFILLLLAAFVLPDTADAQLLKRLKERAKERIEKKVEDKAERAVDKAVDDAAEGVEDAAMSAFERKTQPEALDLGENVDGPADARHVQYRSTTSMDLGAIGKMARLMGQDLEHQTEYVSISGTRQRTDSDKQSTIVDLESDRFIMLNHDQRHYTALTFSEMAERMDEAMAEMKSQSEGMERPDVERQDVDADVSFDISVDRTGQSQTINGSPSEQMLLTMKADFDVQGTDESGEEASVRGTMYALVDTWMSRDVAGLETIQAFQRRMGEQMTAHMTQTDFGQSLQGLGVDPRMGALMEEAGKELQALDGLAVRSTTHLILVPDGQELDVEAALQPPSDDDAGGMSALAQMAAAAENSEDAAPAQQVTLMRSITQISDLKIDPLPDDHFDIPSDYKKVDPF